MHILLIDAHATCAELRTNLTMRKALIAAIVQLQQTPEPIPMQACPIHCIERYPMIEDRLPEPKRPQGMNKPRRLDLHRATKGGRR